MTYNEKNSATAMRDDEIVKTSGEVSSEKNKAIYPHIVVSGDIDKPYYSIQYYDIEKKTMFDCYGSYRLRFVRKWLEELFEVIEPDIADFINRLQADKEALIAGQETLQKALAEKIAEIERLKNECFCIANERDAIGDCMNEAVEEAKAEAIKECLEKVKTYCYENVWFENSFEESKLYQFIDNLVEEKVGESNV